jgi:hypothetical protein
MATPTINVGDIGTVYDVDTEESLAGSTDAALLYEKPGGSTGHWTATVVGTCIRYTTLAGAIDEEGTWKFQGWVALAAGSWSTVVIEEPVGPRLANPTP